jgi:hypothetical protein
VRAEAAAAAPGVRVLAIDGVAPSAAAFRSGAYRAGIPVFAVTGPAPPGAAARWLESARGSGGEAPAAAR